MEKLSSTYSDNVFRYIIYNLSQYSYFDCECLYINTGQKEIYFLLDELEVLHKALLNFQTGCEFYSEDFTLEKAQSKFIIIWHERIPPLLQEKTIILSEYEAAIFIKGIEYFVNMQKKNK